MNYSQKANPNATNSELDAKVIVKPNEMSDRQFLGWNTQTRSQLVDDLYYVCRENGEILEELLDEYVYLLSDNPKRLDELQSYVENEDIIHN